jgi:hypothetical protein
LSWRGRPVHTPTSACVLVCAFKLLRAYTTKHVQWRKVVHLSNRQEGIRRVLSDRTLSFSHSGAAGNCLRRGSLPAGGSPAWFRNQPRRISASIANSIARSSDNSSRSTTRHVTSLASRPDDRSTLHPVSEIESEAIRSEMRSFFPPQNHATSAFPSPEEQQQQQQQQQQQPEEQLSEPRECADPLPTHEPLEASRSSIGPQPEHSAPSLGLRADVNAQPGSQHEAASQSHQQQSPPRLALFCGSLSGAALDSESLAVLQAANSVSESEERAGLDPASEIPEASPKSDKPQSDSPGRHRTERIIFFPAPELGRTNAEIITRPCGSGALPLLMFDGDQTFQFQRGLIVGSLAANIVNPPPCQNCRFLALDVVSQLSRVSGIPNDILDRYWSSEIVSVFTSNPGFEPYRWLCSISRCLQGSAMSTGSSCDEKLGHQLSSRSAVISFCSVTLPNLCKERILYCTPSCTHVFVTIKELLPALHSSRRTESNRDKARLRPKKSKVNG